MGKITSLTGEEFELDGCLGCEIFNGKLTPFGGVLCQDEHFVVTQDFELPIDGFIIISSVRHIEKFTELKKPERESLVDLIGGSIEFINETGKGTQYIFKLKQKVTSSNVIGSIKEKIQTKHILYHQIFLQTV